jgi:hypothetical protein
MQVADFTLGQGDDLDAQELELLVKIGDIGLVPGQAVQGLGHHDVEFTGTGILQQILVPRPERRGAADGAIGIGMEVGPTLVFDEVPA